MHVDRLDRGRNSDYVIRRWLWPNEPKRRPCGFFLLLTPRSFLYNVVDCIASLFIIDDGVLNIE